MAHVATGRADVAEHGHPAGPTEPPSQEAGRHPAPLHKVLPLDPALRIRAGRVRDLDLHGRDGHQLLTVRNLTNGTLYTFRVRAVNRVGPSGTSALEFATPTATLGAPDAPHSLSATPGNRQ